MKILILCPGYPSEENLYNNAFIHTRVKNYKKNNLNIDIFSVNKKTEYKQYKYEGVIVNEGNYESLKKFLDKNKYDRILIHFAWRKIESLYQQYILLCNYIHYK